MKPIEDLLKRIAGDGKVIVVAIILEPTHALVLIAKCHYLGAWIASSPARLTSRL